MMKSYHLEDDEGLIAVVPKRKLSADLKDEIEAKEDKTTNIDEPDAKRTKTDEDEEEKTEEKYEEPEEELELASCPKVDEEDEEEVEESIQTEGKKDVLRWLSPSNINRSISFFYLSSKMIKKII